MQRTHLTRSRGGALVAALVLAAASIVLSQPSQQAITLLSNSQVETAFVPPAGAPAIARDYREFAGARLGEPTEPEVFTLQFNQATKLTAISASNDFHVSGSTCIEGHAYTGGDRCSVWVVFTPQGPGHRTGKLTVSHTGSAEPFLVPTGGTGFGPVVSFIPAQISTVPGTYPSGTGLLNNPNSLAVDGGDNLYIADTSNNLVRYIDSSGTISTIAGGGTHAAATYSGAASTVSLNLPMTVAVDFFGNAFVADYNNNVVREITIGNYVYPQVGGGTGATTACTVAAPCVGTALSISPPSGLAIDAAGFLFIDSSASGNPHILEDNIWSAHPGVGTVYFDGHTGSTNNFSIAVDAYDDLYRSFFSAAAAGVTAQCYILGQNPAENQSIAGGHTWVVAGTRSCGFSGDGGLASGAEISFQTGGFAFDAAGNFYFADSANDRVRRIDEATGIIHTIAGTGGISYAGDGGPATSAPINQPIGLAVDSHGDVYTTHLVPASSINHALLRQIGPAGALSFPLQGLGTTSPVQTIIVSNTGNNALNFTKINLNTSANAIEFGVDPFTTTCAFPSTLPAGQSCLIGVFFVPQGVGARTGSISFSDNTVTGMNTIQLTGSGGLPAQVYAAPSTLTFPATAVGVTSASLSSTLSNLGGVPFSISGYSFVGGATGDFAQTHTCGATVAGGASCTLNVTFRPTGTGERTTTLVVATSAGQGTVTLIGNSGSAAVVPSSITLDSAANPVIQGRLVTFRSQVTSVSSVAPTGVVQLREGSIVLGQASLSAGSATFTLPRLATGQHTLTAWYLGDSMHAPSESPSISQSVVAPPRPLLP